MRIKTSLLFAAMLSTVAAAPAFAASTPPPGAPIKMLPPTDFNGQVCSGANAGLLFWDGVNPIRCVKGSSVDQYGNVTVQSSAVVGGTGNFAGGVQVNGGKSILYQDGSAAFAGGLSVGQSVKVGNTAAACTPEIAGAIRWNGTQFEGCDGKAWSALAGGNVRYPRVQCGYDLSVMTGPFGTWNTPTCVDTATGNVCRHHTVYPQNGSWDCTTPSGWPFAGRVGGVQCIFGNSPQSGVACLPVATESRLPICVYIEQITSAHTMERLWWCQQT